MHTGVLANFEIRAYEMTGNGNYLNLWKLLGKICEIPSGKLIFGHLENVL